MQLNRLGDRIPTQVGALTSALRRRFDALFVAALSLIGLLIRWNGLPADGLWFDDSWVAAGVVHGQLSSILETGSAHPAFTMLLMGVNELGGGLGSLAVPALLAGVAGPPVLYVALRSLGYERAICALMAAALCVSDVHILYSGRVKGYTLDTLLVTGLAVAIPRLARREWSTRTAAAWVVAAFFLGLFSGYVLLATAIAGLLFFLHPAGDRKVRFWALATQGISQLLYVLAARRSTDLSAIEEVMESFYDGHMTFYLNPLDLSAESIRHLRRVADVYPGGSGGWLTAFSLIAIAGLVIGAVKGSGRSETLPARFFLMLIGTAFIGSMLGQFPFGTTTDDPVSSGGRHTLWLVPAIALGMSIALHRLYSAATVLRPNARRILNGVILGSAVIVLVVGYGAAPSYPWSGSRSATAFVEAELGAGDALVVSSVARFAFMSSTDIPLTVVPTPNRMIGFEADYADPRVGQVAVWSDPRHRVALEDYARADPQALLAMVGDSDRVVYLGIEPSSPATAWLDDERRALAEVLVTRGFRPTSYEFGNTLVQIWQRG